MADRKISDLTALTAPASGDYLPIVDISEASAANKNKRITIEELLRGAPDGTAAAPGFAFESDPNTGIYSPGADQLAIATGGSPRVYVDSAGNVGIGTTSPGATLDTRGNVRLGNQGNGDGTTTISTSNGVYIGTNDGTTTTTVVPFQIGAYPAGPGYSSTPDHAIVLDGWSGSTIYHNAIVNRKGRDLSFHTAITGNGFSDTNERVRIDSSGRLLVGTSTSISSAVGFTPAIQAAGASALAAISVGRYSADGNGPTLILQKSRNATIGAQAIIADGDNIGRIDFEGSDGSAFRRGASIDASIDGSPSAGDLPTRLVFSTTADGASSPTERMRIDSTGYSRFLGQNVTVARMQRNGGVGTVIELGVDGNTPGTISCTTTTTSYNTSSDYRLKENVIPLTGAADRVNQLQVHRFNFIANPDATVDGFIAHEAQAVVPECVTGEKDAVDDDGNPIYQGIDQSKLVPLLTAALQEALAEITALKDRVTALEAQ